MRSRSRITTLAPSTQDSSVNIDIIRRENWMDAAACASIDPSYDWFFPENKADEVKAKNICASCPVAWQCLDFSIRTKEVWGIWGGMTFEERCDLTRLHRGHTSPAARSAHRRHLTELNHRKQHSERKQHEEDLSALRRRASRRRVRSRQQGS